MGHDQTPIRFALAKTPKVAARGAVALGGAPPPNPLPIAYVHQTASNWCWATCGTMLSRYFTDSGISICQVVTKIITGGQCCDGAPAESDTSLSYQNPTCNKTCTVAQVAELAGKLNLDVKHVGGQIDINAVSDQIVSQGSPVEVAFSWWGGGGHVALVRGVTLDASTVRVNDPWPDTGDHIVTFRHLQDAYGRGKWFDSWTNYKARGAGG